MMNSSRISPVNKLIFTLLLIFSHSFLFAKEKDSLWAIIKNDNLAIEHIVENGQDVFLLAGIYHIPPAVLADFNDVSYKTVLKEGSPIYIPLGSYNHITKQPGEGSSTKEVYYRTNANDNLSVISNKVGVTQLIIQDWNKMPDNSLHEGQVLLLGWVSYQDMKKEDRTLESVLNAKGKNRKKKSGIPEGIRTLLSEEELAAVEAQSQKEIYHSDSISEEELLYLSQTNHGMVTANDKGTAVFFDMPGKVKNGKYYAFHNFAKRGAIVKIHNPGTGKTVFAKVLGPIPQTQKFYNCIIGISAGAKKELGTTADKMWCELAYVPF